MKVLLVNGSPNRNGCTNRALEEIKKTLEEEGIAAEIFWIGKKPIGGCISCGKCAELKKCVFDDTVNEFMSLAAESDGFVFGSPVYYASSNGSLSAFMDRAFFSNMNAGGKGAFYLKPAAAVASARRAGTITTLDQINKYFSISQMPVISSSYWNEVHGANAEDVEKDEEGLYTMRVLARNMAWFLKIKQAAADAGIPLPTREKGHPFTNFIR